VEKGEDMVVKNTMKNKNYAAAIERGIEKGLEILAIDITGQAAADCPRDTGRLAGSIDYATNKKSGKAVSSPNDKYTVHVGTNVKYAEAVEDGKDPQVITVKNAQVLTDGKTFFGKSVNHPGFAAQPYLRPALDRNRDAKQVDKAVADEMRKENKRG
jgi:recombination DNA repair RAD52 pathway protein